MELVKNHAFVDGNKRIGAHAMLVFLSINGIELEYSQRELVDLFLGLADGRIIEQELVEWILLPDKGTFETLTLNDNRK